MSPEQEKHIVAKHNLLKQHLHNLGIAGDDVYNGLSRIRFRDKDLFDAGLRIHSEHKKLVELKQKSEWRHRRAARLPLEEQFEKIHAQVRTLQKAVPRDTKKLAFALRVAHGQNEKIEPAKRIAEVGCVSQVVATLAPQEAKRKRVCRSCLKVEVVQDQSVCGHCVLRARQTPQAYAKRF